MAEVTSLNYAEYSATTTRTRRERYEAQRVQAWSDRASFDAHWQELADFIKPRRVRFWAGDRNRGDKRNQKIIDSTAGFAARTLASGLHAGLTSPARPWMKLTTPDPDLAESPAVKAWLHTVTVRMLTIFLQSNLYNGLPVVYGDMGIFGTSAMAVLPDERDLFRVYTYPLGSYALGLNARGLVSTFIRDYELTVRQVVENFGVKPNGRDIDWTNISTYVKDHWDRGNYQSPVSIVWIVLPNEHADARRLEAKYLPFLSCHFERSATNTNKNADESGRGFLRESGFRTFPVLCPRWEVSSAEDTYGNDSPGMMALGDVKQLQVMQRRKGQAIEKLIDPPLVGPSALRTQKTSLLPGDITYVDVREGQQSLRAIHEIRIDLDHLRQDMGETQTRIDKAFYVDLFLMLANRGPDAGIQPITAQEVAERHEEKLLALGPVLERTNDELLELMVDRVYEMMDRAGLIPPAPPELHGVSLKVEYTSILAQAQKLVGVVGLDRLLQSLVPLCQTFPALRHKINAYAVANEYADMLGVSPKILYTDAEAEASASAEAEQQQKAQSMQQAGEMAKAAAAAGQHPIAPNSVLDGLVSQLGGAAGGAPGIAGVGA